MARSMYGRKTPGHLIFLIDQSTSMRNKDLDKAQMVVDAVQSLVEEVVFSSIDVDGITPLDRAYLTFIGYGGNPAKAEVLERGWVTDYAEKLKLCEEKGTNIISAIADGWTPMADAFELAKQKIETWRELVEEGKQQGEYDKLPAPTIINITDGLPAVKTGKVEDVEEQMNKTKDIISDIMKLKFDDGCVLIWNIFLDDTKEVIAFPKDVSEIGDSKEGQFLFEISSELESEHIEAAHRIGFEGVTNGSKGMLLNSSEGDLIRFLQFGSSEPV